MFQIKVVEKIETHILHSVTFFFSRVSCNLWGNVKKWGGAREAADDNMVHACWCWISKVTRVQAHARAFADPHARIRARTHTTRALTHKNM